MQKNILGLLVLISSLTLQAQSFHPQVRIEYEKVHYVLQQVKDMDAEWFEEAKKYMPEKVVSYYELVGDTARSLYRQTKEPVIPAGKWYEARGDNNVVYNDYLHSTTTTQKPVAEETFLVEDSLLKIKWKLTADTRTIAGYDCRKAIGIVDDTMALFAFYSDELLVRGGPESVHGLPGTVLGLGVPRLHATWFATKVEVNGVPLANVKPATKGKKTTRGEMMATLDNILKNWGKYGSAMRLYYVL